MKELIKVNYSNDQKPTVSGRELHEALKVTTPYRHWFPRMCEFGFMENRDFRTKLSESSGGRPAMDHDLTIEMAKEICMLQRTEIGKKCREYFLELERRWNSPEAIMARALQMADRQLNLARMENARLLETNAVQAQQISEMKPKASYYDLVLRCPDALPISIIAKDFGWSARRMNEFLHEQGIQYKLQKTWLLYAEHAKRGFTKTETYPYLDTAGNPHTSILTKWTQAGRLFIYNLMKTAGHLPIMEQE